MSASRTVQKQQRRSLLAASSRASVRTLIPLLSGFVLLLAVAAGSVWLLVSSIRFNASVAHTLSIRSDAYRLLTLAQDAETGQRGYVITGNPTYLDPYRSGASEAPKALADLRELTADNPVQQANTARLKIALEAKLRELALTVAMVASGNAAAAVDRVKENVGNNLMEQIRREVRNIQSEEETLQSRQAEAAQRSTRLLAGASLAGILIVFVLAGYTILATSRATRRLVSAQDELRATNDNLESLVADRVAELQAANEEIQRFAYIVSHDLRAPLVNVMGFTSELDAARAELEEFVKLVAAKAPDLVTADIRTTVETDLPEALGFIRSSTSKMDRLINAILKLSREGRRVLTPETIDVAALVAAQGESLSQQLSAGDATLEVAPDLPTIVSDRLAIEQIFGNLIENAIKYLTPGRPGHIVIRGQPHGAYLRYEIQDNGRGIEAKDFERVFELFRRAGEQDRPGEGIGLAYVRNLARRLGGNVSVQSKFGIGSTFTITLPAEYSAKARAK